jgi:hydrogenase maturation protease
VINESERPSPATLHAGQLEIGGRPVVRGGRVRLHPHTGGDVMDAALDGRTGVVESVEQDFEGRYHCVVVVDDDPGSDLGLRRMPGHRFFFAPDEIEPLDEPFSKRAGTPSILVAGIGNIFCGDDAFGVHAVRRLAERPQAAGVAVMDFGIRGYDLAFALIDPHDHVILVDACPRGGEPGTLYVIEPDIQSIDGGDNAGILDGHGMNPMNVLRLATRLGATLEPVIILGCEPETFGPEEGLMGLSQPVEAALDEAVRMIESLIADRTGSRTGTAARPTN